MLRWEQADTERGAAAEHASQMLTKTTFLINQHYALLWKQQNLTSLRHSTHALLNNLLTIPFHLLLYGYIDLLSERILSRNNEYLNQLYNNKELRQLTM